MKRGRACLEGDMNVVSERSQSAQRQAHGTFARAGSRNIMGEHTNGWFLSKLDHLSERNTSRRELCEVSDPVL